MTTTEPSEPQASPAEPQAPSAEPTTRSIVIRDPDIRREIDTMTVVKSYANLMAQSGLFPDVKGLAQAAVKIMAGRELGFSALASMTGFHIIDGKVTASANLMAHAVKRSGRYDYRVHDHTALVCALEFYEVRRNPATGEELARERLGESVFSIEDARIAHLLGSKGQMWEKYPKNMLFARAMSNGIGWFCPDVFETRVYTPDEIRPDLELNSDGAVIDVESFVVEPPREEPAQREQQPPRDAGRPDNRPGRPAGEQRPARQQQAPRPAAPPPDAATAPRMENIGHVLTWAMKEPRKWNRNEVMRRLGVEDIASISDFEAAYRKLLLSAGGDAPAESDSPYPWLAAFTEALAGWEGMKAEEVLTANGEEVSDGEPYESIFARLDVFIRSRPDMTVEAIVEQAANYLDNDNISNDDDLPMQAESDEYAGSTVDPDTGTDPPEPYTEPTAPDIARIEPSDKPF